MCSNRLASGASSSALLPQLVRPSNGPLPVAARIRPMPGSITAPARPHIALSPCVLVTAQDLAAISRWRLEHSLFQTWTIRPVPAIDRHDVPVVGRDVADIAAGDRHHPCAARR